MLSFRTLDKSLPMKAIKVVQQFVNGMLNLQSFASSSISATTNAKLLQTNSQNSLFCKQSYPNSPLPPMSVSFPLISLFQSVCLCVCVCMYLSHSVRLFVSLFTVCLCLSVCMFVCLSLCFTPLSFFLQLQRCSIFLVSSFSWLSNYNLLKYDVIRCTSANHYL